MRLQDTENKGVELTPNPRIMRALAKSEITGNFCLPVDTLNTSLLVVDDLPFLPHIKKRKQAYKIGNRTISFHLRFLYLAIREMSIENEMTLSFATVHFSEEFEKSLLGTKRKPASNYGEQLTKLFRAASHPVEFFLVLEQGKKGQGKRLHSHMIIMHHPDDIEVITEKLKNCESNPQTGVRIGDTYEITVTLEPDSFEQVAMELDIEHGISQYRPCEKEPNDYHREYAVNIGSADYMSKELIKMKRKLNSSPIFASKELRARANKLHDQLYKKQQLLKAQGKLL